MALQRAIRRVFASVVVSCVAATATGAPAIPAHAPAMRAPDTDLFDEIYRRGAPIERSLQTLSARFVETTSSPLLKAPQVGRGTLLARRPDQVRLDYAAPDARTVIVDGDRLSLDWPAREMRGTRDIGATMRRARRFLQPTSPAELRKHFDIAARVATDRKGAWLVTFTPRRTQMREGVSRVHLWIDQDSLLLQALKMEYPGGDSRLLEFADIRVNPAVPPDAFVAASR
jgi:outer membrane lipoprotein-sorting protein